MAFVKEKDYNYVFSAGFCPYEILLVAEKILTFLPTRPGFTAESLEHCLRSNKGKELSNLNYTKTEGRKCNKRDVFFFQSSSEGLW